MASQTKTKATFLDKVSTLADDKSSLQARLAFVTFYRDSPSITTDKIILVLDYIQLMSPLLIFASFLPATFDFVLFRSVLFIARLANPAYWISFYDGGPLEYGILGLVASFTLFKVFLFVYILQRCRQTSQPTGLLVMIWRTLMKFQAHLTYFYVSYVYVSAIKVIDWQTVNQIDSQYKGVMAFAIILILLELALALVPKLFFHLILPTKDFLSSKNNTLEVVMLLQKMFIQGAQTQFDFMKPESNWIFSVVNVIICLFCIGYFYRTLPLYKFKALHFQSWLIMMVASLNLSCFSFLIIKKIEKTFGGIMFIMILWAILFFLMMKAGDNLLKRAFWRLTCDPTLNDPNLLVHRIVAIKELKKTMKIEEDSNNNFSLLAHQTLNSHLPKILWAKTDENSNINTKASANLMFLDFLEKLREKYPKNQYIQIFLAEFNLKAMKIFSAPIRMSVPLRKHGDWNIRINAELLLMRIQSQIQNKFNTYDHSNKAFVRLDLNSFVLEHVFVAKLKLEMLQQTTLQLNICSEIMKENPSLELIFQESQKAHRQRQHIIRRINHIPTALSEYNIDSLLLSAKYHLSLNHSIKDHLHFTKVYSQKLMKYQKYFSQEKFCPQSVFQGDVSILFISGKKGEEGKILYASKSTEAIFGVQAAQYSGMTVPMRTPPIWRPIYELSWKYPQEDPETTYMGKMDRCIMYHMNNYLVEVDYFVDTHAFTTQGFNFFFLIRKVISNREFIILHENGDIDSMSKGLLERLGFHPQTTRTHIKSLCEELEIVNQACNIIAFPSKYTEDSKTEAEEIHKKYTTLGQNIHLKPPHDDNKNGYSYHCKIESLLLGSLIIKTLILEENKRENRERTHELTSPINSTYRTTRTQKEVAKKLKSSTSSSSDMDFATEEEKEEGWIDFEPLTGIKSTSNEIQSPRALYSPQTTINTPREDLATQRQLLSQNSSPNRFTSTLKKLNQKNTVLEVPFSGSTKDQQNDGEISYHRKVKASINTSILSRSSRQQRISNIFQASLDAKYHSKAFWGLLALFVISAVILGIMRIIIKSLLDQNMSTLVAKKDIFSQNAYRSYQLIETSGLTRFVWQIYSGALTLADYGADSSGMYYGSMSFVLLNIQELRDANKAVLKASNILTGDAHELLYEKNVEMYDTYFDDPVQSFISMDAIQATDRIVETGLDIYNAFMNSAVTEQLTTRAKFLFRNSLNDLISVSNSLSFTMRDSFNDQFNRVQAIFLAYVVFTLSFLSMFFVILVVFIYKQYHTEAFHISAVCRLNHAKLQAIQKEFLHFQSYIKEEGSTIDPEKSLPTAHGHQKYTTTIQGKTREETAAPMNHIKRETIKAPDHKKIQRRHWKYVIGTAIVLLLVFVLIIISGVNDNLPLKRSKANQEKLLFINRLRVTMGMGSTTFRELAATNNAAYIENMIAEEKLDLVIKQILSLRADIYTTLLNNEILEEDPELQTLLLGEGCYMLNKGLHSFCDTLKERGLSTGFIYLMNDFVTYLSGKLEDYRQSNKTKEALIELQTKDYNSVAYVYVVALNELNMLSKAIDNQFDANVEDASNDRVRSITVFFVLLVLTNILGWIYLLKQLGESTNYFKNILRVFTPELVFSSFILKSFLMKTSKEAVEQIRNEV